MTHLVGRQQGGGNFKSQQYLLHTERKLSRGERKWLQRSGNEVSQVKVEPLKGRSENTAPNVKTILKVCAVACCLYAVAQISVAHAMPLPISLAWSCPTPPGSYLETCAVRKAEAYAAVDPMLAEMQFCIYHIGCKRLLDVDFVSYPQAVREQCLHLQTYEPTACQRECADLMRESWQNTTKIMTKEDLPCAQFWENCDGELIVRESDERLCTTPYMAKAELMSRGLWTREC
jgi:hypothetical protein